MSARRMPREEWLKLHDEYLKSERWRELREAVMARDGWRCQMCGGRATQAHHLTYARWRKEKLFDLVAFCDACHEDEHRQIDAAADEARMPARPPMSVAAALVRRTRPEHREALRLQVARLLAVEPESVWASDVLRELDAAAPWPEEEQEPDIDFAAILRRAGVDP